MDPPFFHVGVQPLPGETTVETLRRVHGLHDDELPPNLGRHRHHKDEHFQQILAMVSNLDTVQVVFGAGHLAGDGSIVQKPSKLFAQDVGMLRCGQSLAQVDFLRLQHTVFAEFSVASDVKLSINEGGGMDGRDLLGVRFHTVGHVAFSPLYRLFYARAEETIKTMIPLGADGLPADWLVHPLSLGAWHMGDGSLFQLSVCTFAEAGVRALAQKLKAVHGLDARVWLGEGKWAIGYCSADYPAVRKLLMPYMQTFFAYKVGAEADVPQAGVGDYNAYALHKTRGTPMPTNFMFAVKLKMLRQKLAAFKAGRAGGRRRMDTTYGELHVDMDELDFINQKLGHVPGQLARDMDDNVFERGVWAVGNDPEDEEALMDIAIEMGRTFRNEPKFPSTGEGYGGDGEDEEDGGGGGGDDGSPGAGALPGGPADESRPPKRVALDRPYEAGAQPAVAGSNVAQDAAGGGGGPASDVGGALDDDVDDDDNDDDDDLVSAALRAGGGGRRAGGRVLDDDD